MWPGKTLRAGGIWGSEFGFLRGSWYYFFLRGILAWHFAGMSPASFSPAKSPARQSELQMFVDEYVKKLKGDFEVLFFYTYIECTRAIINVSPKDCSNSKDGGGNFQIFKRKKQYILDVDSLLKGTDTQVVAGADMCN